MATQRRRILADSKRRPGENNVYRKNAGCRLTPARPKISVSRRKRVRQYVLIDQEGCLPLLHSPAFTLFDKRHFTNDLPCSSAMRISMLLNMSACVIFLSPAARSSPWNRILKNVNIPGMETVDAAGRRVTPGLIDQHIHVTGGGGEGGWAAAAQSSISPLLGQRRL